MHKFKKRRPFQLLLTAGLCLGALNSTGAALWLEEPVRPPVAPVVEFQETEVPVPSPEEEARAAAERTRPPSSLPRDRIPWPSAWGRTTPCSRSWNRGG